MKFIVSKIVVNKVREKFPSVLFGNVELLWLIFVGSLETINDIGHKDNLSHPKCNLFANMLLERFRISCWENCFWFLNYCHQCTWHYFETVKRRCSFVTSECEWVYFEIAELRYNGYWFEPVFKRFDLDSGDSGRIDYDEKAVLSLLDRTGNHGSEAPPDEDKDMANEYLASFKVREEVGVFKKICYSQLVD